MAKSLLFLYLSMTKKNNSSNEPTEEKLDVNSTESVENTGSVENQADNNSSSEDLDPVQVEKEKYIRLYSEFDNFRRRTAKERVEWMQTASKDVILNVLPVIDDMERALKSMESSDSMPKEAIEGMSLIYKKLYSILEKNGLTPMNAQGKDFDPDLHEAITQFSAPSPDMVGKVIDEVEKGYLLNDKVIRFAKVVVGN